MTFRPRALILAAVATGAGALLLVPALAYAAPGSTKKIMITRAVDDPHRFEIAWQPVTGADHYNVSVFDGTADTVAVIPAGTTTLTRTQSDSCSRLRVNIGSRDSAGLGATSHNVWLRSLAPGGISGLQANRNPDGTLTATWKAPNWPGYGAAGTYQIQLIRQTDKTIAFEGQVTEATATIAGIDQATAYTVAVTPQNAFGSCSTAKLTVGTTLPGSVGSLKAVRDSTTPSQVRVSWSSPAYPGTSPVTSYTVGFGTTKPTKFSTVTETATVLDLGTDTATFVQVQAVNSAGGGKLGSIKVPVAGAPTVAAVPPGVTIETSGAQIIVRLTGRIGGNATYPKLVVRIQPASGGPGYTDEQWGQNGAQSMTFGAVPTGFYLVQVNGANDTEEAPWGRKTVTIGDAGVLTAESWQLVRGKATVTADAITSGRKGGETSILANARTTTANLALGSTVAVRAGRGYGVWMRASVDKNKKISGYLVAYDPGYAKNSPSIGPSIALRTQYQDKLCTAPLAVVKVPTKIAASETQRLLVIVNGDTLYATIDDTVVLDLPSIAAVTPASCGAAPNGSQAGFWVPGDSDSATTFTHTTLN